MKKKPYRFFVYLLLRCIHIIILILPYKCAVFLGGLVGSMAYKVLPKYRKVTLDNLRSAFTGEKSEETMQGIAVNVFRNLGMTAAECLSLTKISSTGIKKLMAEEEFHKVKEVLAKNKKKLIIALMVALH